MSAVAPRRRRGRRAALVVVVTLVLLVVAAVAGDWIARRAIADRAAASLREALALPADRTVDVEVAGWAVLPQLIAGRLDRLDLRSSDVVFGELDGDVAATLIGVPVSAAGAIDSGSTMVAIDAASVAQLVTERSTVPVDEVTLDPPLMRVSASVDVLGVTLGAGVGMQLAVVDGAIQLTPAEISAAGATFSVTDFRDRFGAVSGDLLAPTPLCIADSVPRGLTLTGVEVAEESLNASFALSPTFLSDPAEQEPGTCS
ncbi:hypothetical protein C5C20_00795 [Rathayibacter rathayi]|uniref:DUF2993 domain-containing protein n=1 Tax=Rathayibacter rathayi TaxID=33887 RepID=A0ABD6WCA3_RATRA|nr:hypothetical protein C5C04_00790 [Rathayibacter rathayi]PPF25620.1 hypothetical protein C5C34_02090 [Rathayibacter rathayi]PPF83534.1 hypothetical protein C5C14_00800 [Rathayibacter rathayi]PPG16199.1 hypothetical protein C5C11_00650 [Rathayibacter rathayi]PPG47352.1 hypothetical protein C5C20_00795 [Rathayibacter rathayi]